MTTDVRWLHANLAPLYWSSRYPGMVDDVTEPLNRYCVLLDDWSVCVCVYVCVCVCVCTCVRGWVCLSVCVHMSVLCLCMMHDFRSDPRLASRKHSFIVQ